MLRRLAYTSLAVLVWLCSLPSHAQSPSRDDDPYAYDLRSALFPVVFTGGIAASYLGAAGRVELDLGRRVTAQLAGHYNYAPVLETDAPHDFAASAYAFVHLSDRVSRERLGGPVYPEDTPAVGGQGRASDHDLDVPVHQKLGGPRMTLPEKARERVAPLRRVYSLRVGVHYLRAVMRPERREEEPQRFVQSTYPALSLGFGWGNHHNLSAATAGSREVGFRRYYVDLVLTLPSLIRVRPSSERDADVFPAGVQVGMEGSLAALLAGADGVGLGYSLSLGALPARTGLSGYLMLALGLALDAETGLRSRR